MDLTSDLDDTVEHLDALPVVAVQGLYMAPHKLTGLAQSAGEGD